MTIKRLGPEDLLALNKYEVDEGNSHIIVDATICATCQQRACLVTCPARCYRLKDGEVHFEYAGCLECGACRILCSDGGVTSWSYPRAGFGINYRCS